jgi:hypothetical protein
MQSIKKILDEKPVSVKKLLTKPKEVTEKQFTESLLKALQNGNR